MKKNIQTVFAALLIVLFAAPAFAQNVVPPPPTLDASVNANASGAGVSAGAKLQTRITTAQNRANQEIDRRVTALTDLNTKVQAMVKVSATAKANMANEISTQISALGTLKAKIDADTDITTLKTDIGSITASYRIFMLIIPQSRIVVASDKLGTVADSMTAISAKIQTRITAAQSAGKDVTSLTTTLSDMNAKLSDANVQSSAAASEVVSLSPDSGDKTKMAANDQALKDARSKLKVAMADLQTARQDITALLAGLKSVDASASATAQ